MENVMNILHTLFLNWQEALTGGVIVSCAVIFLMGVLKKMLDKTALANHKNVRKTILAFGSLAMTFPVTAIYFFGKGISFNYYWYGCILCCMSTVFTYWAYENTNFRELIHKIGAKTVGKYWSIFYEAYVEHKNNKDTSTQLAMTTAELSEVVKTEIKKQIKEDNDLKGL